MNMQPRTSLPPPPGVFGALRSGFDAVANHVTVIGVPLVLDLLLWFGPRLGIERLLNSSLQLAFAQARRAPNSTDLDQLNAVQTVLLEWIHRFNLVSLISKLGPFPIGVPSLLSKTLPVDSPIGPPQVVDVSSGVLLFLLLLFFMLLSWLIGAFYFRWVSRVALGSQTTPVSLPWAALQTVILSICWLVGLIFIFVPVTLVLALLTAISPILANGVAFLALLFGFWLVVPLFFVPHGIFARRQNAFASALTSLRMARFTFPSSGMFVISVLILSQGLNYLWSVPESQSWMTFVGLAGHAFITTAVLAASFVYYRDTNTWLQTIFDLWQKANAAPKQTV